MPTTERAVNTLFIWLSLSEGLTLIESFALIHTSPILKIKRACKVQINGLFISIVLFLSLSVGSFIMLTLTSVYRANQQSDIVETKTEFKSDLVSIQKILQLKIPSSEAPVPEWQDYFKTVKRMKVRKHQIATTFYREKI